MNITVVVCTYNRSAVLAKALGSVAASSLPEGIEWEVVVVDNNSDDETCTVVEEFCRRYPSRFRYVFEPYSGKSFALNTGLREARGEVIAFLDDDVSVETTWLQNLTAGLHDKKWAGAGGRTLPAQSISPPSWLALDGPDSMAGILYAHFDLGDEPCELTIPPYGANMAFRRELFELYGGFRTDLGPSPRRDVPRPNEDTEFGRRVLAAGWRLLYEPSAIVHHPVLDVRIKKEYLLAWWFDYGRALIREKRKRPPFLGIPRHYLSIPVMVGFCLLERALRWMCSFNPQQRFSKKCWTWLMAGQILETYRLAKKEKRNNRRVRDLKIGVVQEHE